MDWARLAETVRDAVHFLDDVVSINAYVPAIPELKEAAWRGRRIGLGFMGLADVLFAVGARYGADDGLSWAVKIVEWIQYHAINASSDLAIERGPFPAISGSPFDPVNFRWTPPVSQFADIVAKHESVIDRPPVDWIATKDRIMQYGIRNAAVTTVAPTGTIATVAGVEGYGIEPVFRLSYTRSVNQSAGGGPMVLRYASPLFEKAMEKHGISKDDPEFQKVLIEGTCADANVPQEIKRVFVTTGDVSTVDHVRMQAAVQDFTSNSISKTINLPAGSLKEDVLSAYMHAWKLKCRGITVYVDKSRKNQVLNTVK